MGLSIFLAASDPDLAEQLALPAIDALLAEAGLTPHREPKSLPAEARSRAGLCRFPYNDLHRLRRVYAHVAEDPDWQPTPAPSPYQPGDDPVLESEIDMLCSHLVCHSDAEGLYLPIDFDDPLFAKQSGLLPGDILGSSFALRRELQAIAPALGIRLGPDGALDDAEIRRLESDDSSPFQIEIAVWLALYEASRLSLEYGSAIVFA